MRGGPPTVRQLIEGIEVDVYEEIRRTSGVSTADVCARLAEKYDADDVRRIVRMLKSKDLIRKIGLNRNRLPIWRVI